MVLERLSKSLLQWLFLLEALPAVLMGIVMIFYLAKSPGSAKFLNTEEQEWLLHRLSFLIARP